MFDLGKEQIEVECDCGVTHTANFQDAIDKKIIRCRCGTNIQLNDDNGSVSRSVSELNKAFKDLDDTLKSLI